MNLDKSHHYVFRIGSDNQHRLQWNGSSWLYEFLAGGVLFDSMNFEREEELEDALSVHGLSVSQFQVDETGAAAGYSAEIRQKMKRLTELGIEPCAKHGLSSKNQDGTCEACSHPDYWDDHKGTEG